MVQPEIASDEKREVPDYDGRGDDPVTAGDVFIWIPRGVFFPIYLVSEYVIRAPLRALTVAFEENDVQAKLTEFFTFGPGGKSGLVPSFLIDFGLRPSIGLYFFSDDIFDVEGLGVRAHGAFGGVDWYRGTLGLRYTIEEDGPTTYGKFVQLKGVYSHRPDWLYWGEGPDTINDDESEYTAQYIEGFLRYEGGFWRSSRLTAEAGVRDVVFRNSSCCNDDELRIGQAIAQGRFPRPELFDDGYLIARVGLNGAIDTRKRRDTHQGLASDFVQPNGTGVKLGLRGDLATGLRESPTTEVDPNRPTRTSFAHYGATLGSFIDVYNQRTIGLQAIVDFVDPLQENAPIPFSELVSLGGNQRPMRGFLQHRMLGRSSFVASVEYSWPIWVFLDGVAHYSVGNVFGEHLEDFRGKKFRQSFGLGFRGNGSRDHAFEFLIGGGTETFEQGAELESFRLVFGATEGF